MAIEVIIALALFFDYTNGFHDAANAIATARPMPWLAPVTSARLPASSSK